MVGLVKVGGFEPPTFWPQTRRATGLRYTLINWLRERELNPRHCRYERHVLTT